MTLNATRLIYVKRSFKYYRETHCVTCAFHGKFHAKSLRRLWQFHRPVPHTRGMSLCIFETKRNVSIRILKSLNIVNLLKIKIIANLPQLMCVVVSAAQNGEFERFRGFCVDCYYTLGDNKGVKIIFYRSSA